MRGLRRRRTPQRSLGTNDSQTAGERWGVTSSQNQASRIQSPSHLRPCTVCRLTVFHVDHPWGGSGRGFTRAGGVSSKSWAAPRRATATAQKMLGITSPAAFVRLRSVVPGREQRTLKEWTRGNGLLASCQYYQHDRLRTPLPRHMRRRFHGRRRPSGFSPIHEDP